MFLSRQKEAFSEVYYDKHRTHLRRVFRKAAIYFAISATIAALFYITYKQGKASIWELVISIAVFLWLLFGICYGVPQSFRVRLVPYFEKRLGGIETFASGTALLAHSRQLDDIASALGARSLSQFSSGDDLIPGEQLAWHEPGPALETIETLLKSDAAKNFSPDLYSDLVKLQTALETAKNRDVRFCLLLREGSSAETVEMSKRQGSFE
jgi:hypothetical protein